MDLGYASVNDLDVMRLIETREFSSESVTARRSERRESVRVKGAFSKRDEKFVDADRNAWGEIAQRLIIAPSGLKRRSPSTWSQDHRPPTSHVLRHRA